MSLGVRILLTTTTLVVAIVGILLGVLGVVVSQQTEALVYSSAQSAVSVLDGVLKNRQETQGRMTEFIAAQPGTRSIINTDPVTVRDYLNEQLGRVSADWLVMTDAEGRVIGTSNYSPIEEDADVSSYASFATTIDGGTYSGLGAQGPQASLLTAAPVSLGNYNQGVLISGTNIDAKFLVTVSELAQTPVRIGNLQEDVPSQNLVRREINGEPHVGTTRSLPVGKKMAYLTFIAYVPESEIKEGFAPLWRALAGLLIVGLLAALVIGVRLSRSLTAPLEGVVSAAQEIKNGSWPEAFDSKRKDEIGLLQNVFDEMSSSLRDSRAKLLSMVDMDPLTELANYRSFREQLAERIETWSMRHGPLAVLYMDIDQFEEYNQRHGVTRGDEALRELADALKQAAGEEGLVGRVGGNEFCLCTSSGDAIGLAENLRLKVEDSKDFTISVGVAMAGPSTDRSALLMLAAELANGQAKTAGRNRVRTFEGFDMSANDDALHRFLEQGSYSAVLALAEAVDAKDHYTRGHSQRVAEYARKLAEAISDDSGFIDLVYLTGTLHDVGKIGVPDAALSKPGRLTDEEFDAIKLHPVLGVKIVEKIPQLRDTLPGIRNHHERWDGRGYPDKISGDQIPLLGRILAVADTFDAMTSDRPYRKGMDQTVALEEIARCAGTQFDPELAAKFVEIMGGDQVTFKQAA